MAWLTLLAVMLLILVGGVVRVSGSGLGCPDWPKCWGVWLPPESLQEVDLPAVLKEFRVKDPSLEMTDLVELFDPVKMWIEYINRLLGVLIGIFVLGTFFFSVPLKKGYPKLFWISLLALIMVIFQGWLGGQLVKSHLQAGMITFHMLMAIVLLAVLVYLVSRARERVFTVMVKKGIQSLFTIVALLLLILTVYQVTLGASVREGVDFVMKSSPQLLRSEVLAEVGWRDHLHRLSSWSVLLSCGGLVYLTSVKKAVQSGGFLVWGLFFLIILQIALGISLAYLALPPVSQVLHVGAACLIVCLSFLLLISIRTEQGSFEHKKYE